MATTAWTDADTKRAQQIWRDYSWDRDLSDRIDHTAGIDPRSGRVWLGESAADIVRQMEEAGEAVPLYFVRVGRDYYLRKGGRR